MLNNHARLTNSPKKKAFSKQGRSTERVNIEHYTSLINFTAGFIISKTYLCAEQLVLISFYLLRDISTADGRVVSAHSLDMKYLNLSDIPTGTRSTT